MADRAVAQPENLRTVVTVTVDTGCTIVVHLEHGARRGSSSRRSYPRRKPPATAGSQCPDKCHLAWCRAKTAGSRPSRVKATGAEQESLPVAFLLPVEGHEHRTADGRWRFDVTHATIARPPQQIERVTYSVTEVSRLTGLSRRSIYYAVGTGAIAGVRVGRRLLIPAKAVDQLGQFKAAS